MKTVFMEGVADCAAACLAMAVGFKRASQVYPLLGYNPSTSNMLGVTDSEVVAVLNTMRKRYHFCIPREKVAESIDEEPAGQMYRTSLPTMAAVQAKLGSMLSGCAIVGVPSLTMAGAAHFVFCRKGEVYDPQPSGLRYNGTANSLPVLLAIFVED